MWVFYFGDDTADHEGFYTKKTFYIEVFYIKPFLIPAFAATSY
jgi:hypothetical protein